jgi:hypothetical protein
MKRAGKHAKKYKAAVPAAVAKIGGFNKIIIQCLIFSPFLFV